MKKTGAYKDRSTLSLLAETFPIFHVEDGDGNSFTASYSFWTLYLIQWLFLVNVIGWGIYGAVELVDKVI